jgi:hypothetical protein
MPSILGRSLCGALLAVSLAGAAQAGPDWNQFTDMQTVEVISTEEDGSQRLTTVWIVVLDYQAYIRTAGTRWGDNVEREGKLRLRVPAGEWELRAEKVLSPSEIERVVAAFREKYGRTDALMEWLRFGERRVFRLVE